MTEHKPFDLIKYLAAQRAWSNKTFGPGPRLPGIIKHIEKELYEVAIADSLQNQLEEWCDVVILALDGALRAGFTPEEVCEELSRKLGINRARKWPLIGAQELAVEHIRPEKDGPKTDGGDGVS